MVVECNPFDYEPAIHVLASTGCIFRVSPIFHTGTGCPNKSLLSSGFSCEASSPVSESRRSLGNTSINFVLPYSEGEDFMNQIVVSVSDYGCMVSFIDDADS